MAQRGSNKKVANKLVAASCAAVLTVYTAGYARTQKSPRFWNRLPMAPCLRRGSRLAAWPTGRCGPGRRKRRCIGKPLDRDGIAAALAAASEGIAPITDPIASAWYRAEVLPVHLGRLLLT